MSRGWLSTAGRTGSTPIVRLPEGRRPLANKGALIIEFVGVRRSRMRNICAERAY